MWIPKRFLAFTSYIAFGFVIAGYQGCGQNYDPSVSRAERLIDAGFAQPALTILHDNINRYHHVHMTREVPE